MMMKLNALILSAAMVPAFALSSIAFADDRADQERAGQERAESAGQQESGGQDRSGLERAESTDQQRAGQQRAESAGQQQSSGQETAGQERAGEQYMSGKPAGAFYADEVIGNNVKHRGTDEDVGVIQDLVIGEDGRILGVVVTTGGFLGLGGQDVGLGWDHIEHSRENDESVFYTDMDEETLKNAPEYERD